MPYGDIEEAFALAHKGKGSLVASEFTNDPKVAEELGGMWGVKRYMQRT